jgi:hypothetical protein
MPIGSGTVSFSDIRTEFGGSGGVSISDYYRGTTNVRANAANNATTNLAASVPESGALDFSDYRNTAKGFKKTYSSTATNQDLSTVFGDDYAVDYPKQVEVQSGVELGGESNSQYGIHVSSGSSGAITITNQGTITGAGGPSGGAGGSAVRVNTPSVTFTNNGTLRGGGGAGGNGGAGGAGGAGGNGGPAYTNAPPTNQVCGGNCASQPTMKAKSNNSFGSCAMGDMSYSACYTIYGPSGGGAGGAGGSGGGAGAGGVGQGYGQDAGTGTGGSSGSSGSGGSSGGSQGTSTGTTSLPGNGGTGGSGGNGGTGGAGGSFGNAGTAGGSGTSGSSGSTGSNSFYAWPQVYQGAPGSGGDNDERYVVGSSGSGGQAGGSGQAGGAAGNALLQSVACSFTNNGTVQGAT